MKEALSSLLPALVFLQFQLVTLAAYIVLAVRDRRYFPNLWRPGLAVGLGLFLMLIPAGLFGLAHFDGSVIPMEARIPLLVGMVLGAVIQVLKIGWHMVLVVVAVVEWQRVRRGAPTGSLASSWTSWKNVAGAFAFGTLAASVSLIVFMLLNIQEGRSIIALRDFFPTAAESSAWITMPVLMLVLIAFAVSEELVFRGGMLAWVVGRTRNRVVLRYLGVTAITLMWALAHIPNTNAPVAKVTQMFVIGIAFAEIARRDGVWSAVAAHIGLNVASVGVAYLWEWIY